MIIIVQIVPVTYAGGADGYTWTSLFASVMCGKEPPNLAPIWNYRHLNFEAPR